MALEKQTIVDLIETLENGCVQVRTVTRILDDGVAVSSSFHRHVVCPGDDYGQEDPRVQAICAVVQTPEVVAQYQAQLEANKPQVLTPAE